MNKCPPARTLDADTGRPPMPSKSNPPLPFVPTCCLRRPKKLGLSGLMVEGYRSGFVPAEPPKEKKADPYEPRIPTTTPDEFRYLAVIIPHQNDEKPEPKRPFRLDMATQLLFEAVKEGDYEKAERAISDGADVNAENRTGRRPLDVAYDNIDLRMFRFLKAHGAE